MDKQVDDVKYCVRHKEQLIAIIGTLNNLRDYINTKIQGFKEKIKSSEDPESFYFLMAKLSFIKELSADVDNGIQSAVTILEFMRMSNALLKQQIALSKEEVFLRNNLTNVGNKFIRISTNYTALSCHYEIQSEKIEYFAYALFVVDPYYFARDKVENEIWNLSIFNNTENTFITLPDELLDIKAYCNYSNDDVTPDDIRIATLHYTQNSLHDSKLAVRLGYISKLFYECRNYNGALVIQNIALDVMQQQKLSKGRVCDFKLCKSMILAKMNDDEAAKLIVDSIEYLDELSNKVNDSVILISREFMNMGCILAGWNFIDAALDILNTSLEKLYKKLPESYNYWMENLFLLSRFLNDDGQFTAALIIAAPGIDYFHISNFGKIDDLGKPVYQVAVEISRRGRIVKMTKQLKYPIYLPKNVVNLLREMMISFSGLGERSSINVIENWLERCEMLSGNLQTNVIEFDGLLTGPEATKTVARMLQNRTTHEKLFNDRFFDSKQSY